MWQLTIESLPWLVAMLVLIACSGFFSASEAALFSLRWPDRHALSEGRAGQRVAAGLLSDPERLLTAVLFWNLVINMAYFAIVSIVGLRWRESAAGGDTWAALFGVASLLAIIFFSEMLPKSLAVLSARRLSGLVGVPLAVAVRVVDPLLPIFRFVNLVSQRLIWPRFRPEPYLEVGDLERVIEVSSSDEQILEHERAALQNIVLLSDLRAEEWMRPRGQYQTYRPPVARDDLNGQLTPSGHLLVSEPDNEEVAASINLRTVPDLPEENLETLATPVIYVPWCSTVADVLQRLHREQVEVAAVVNEFGETIGILSMDDLLDTVFATDPTRSDRLNNRKAIEKTGPGVWKVTGITSVRRLARLLNVSLPQSRSVTIAGLVQDSLQRLAVVGDSCEWGPYRLEVLEATERGTMLVELRQIRAEETTS